MIDVRIYPRILWAGLVGLVLVSAHGCRTAESYREEADSAASDIIAQGQRDALGREQPFTIETPTQTLRRKLIETQGLPVSHAASQGSALLDPPEHWPEDDYLTRERPDADDAGVEAGDGPVLLTLEDALRVTAANSREYQQQKEQVFLTALELDLERDAFRNTYLGLISGDLEGDLSEDGADTIGTRGSGEFGIDRTFKNGLSLSSRLFVDVVQLLNRGRDSSRGIAMDLSATLPLLAGAGRHIVTEPLTQAERDVLYALWNFERFKRTLAVSVATDYLQVLQLLDRVDNAAENYRRLIASYERARALADAGRLPEIQVGQAAQDRLRARDGWIAARESYAQALDRFKITLGLPTDAAIELAPEELERLAETARDVLGGMDVAVRNYDIAGEQITLTAPERPGVGLAGIGEARLTDLAFGNRLDLRTEQFRIGDRMRQAVVAADLLRPGLNLEADASVGERRSISGDPADDAEIRFDDGNYGFGLTFNFPWEKLAERNAYRAALINIEQRIRDMQALEDNIKLDVRNALRDLTRTRESFRIQAQAVELAEARVESTNLFLQAGRAEIRDLLEAQEASINAQNALTTALVDFRVAELELQRDLGVLDVDERGLWTEYRVDDPDAPEDPEQPPEPNDAQIN